MAPTETQPSTPPVEPAPETGPASAPVSTDAAETAAGTTPAAAASSEAAQIPRPAALAVSADDPAGGKPGLFGKLYNALSKAEVVIAILGLTVTITVFVFSSFGALRTTWNLFRRQPLDVSLRFPADRIDVIPGKAFVTRIAVENYTDWYKPYVKLIASLAPADDRAPIEPDAFSPPRLDPPDVVRLEPCGRVFVEVSARVNTPGKYVLRVASRPLYHVPAAAVRREEDWLRLLAATPQQGEPCIVTIPVIAHRAEDFSEPTLAEVMPDKTNCRVSVTLTAGQNYPYGLRITARTPARSRTWFQTADPAVGVPEANADTSDAAIANGAYVMWKTERMEALETREFALFLNSHAEYDPARWKEIVKGMQFSAAALQETEKP